MESENSGPMYRYVPAGVSDEKSGMTIYVKYKKNPRRILLKEKSPNHLLFSTPDRDIQINSGGLHCPSNIPPLDNWDEVVYPSPMWPHETVGHGGVDIFMMNYTTFLGSKDRNSPNLREAGRSSKVDQTIMSDSGGYQLMSERLDFVNPLDIVEWYNRNVDVGIVLDVPLGGRYWENAHTEQAEAQAAVTAHMMAGKSTDLELMNVIHGETLKHIAEYRGIVERDDIDRMAMAGMYFNTISKGVYNVLHVLQSGRPYKHWHMLGLSHPKSIYPLMRMAGKGIVKNLTSDGSTYAQEGRYKRMFLWPTIDSKPKWNPIGIEYNIGNNSRHLPCTCPICSSIKYADILSEFDEGLITMALVYHNMYAYVNFTRTMYDIVSTASLKDVTDLIKAQFPANEYDQQKELVSSMGLVDHVAENGLSEVGNYGSIKFYLAAKSNDEGRVETPQGNVESFSMPSLGLDNDSEEVDGETLSPVRYDETGMYIASYYLEEGHPHRRRIEGIHEWMKADPDTWSSKEMAEKDTGSQHNKEKMAKRINVGAQRTHKPGKAPVPHTHVRGVRKKRGTRVTDKVKSLDKELPRWGKRNTSK